ncbi:MAG: mechanosensitive ion channel family protein [Armatimonadota bacterium]
MLVLSLFAAPLLAQGQATVLDPISPIEIEPLNKRPVIAADAQGNVVVVFWGKRDDEYVLWSLRNSGGTWSGAEVPLPAGEDTWFSFDLYDLAGRNGQFALLLKNRSHAHYTVWSGGSWSTPVEADSVQGFIEYVRDVWLGPLPMKLAYGILAAGAFELVYLLTNRLIRRAIAPVLRRDAAREPAERVRRRRIVQGLPVAVNRALWYTIALLMILRIFGLRIGAELLPVLAFAGVAALVIGKNALRDCLSGWLINWENLYAPGDRVTIGEHRGTVTGLSLRTTTIRTRDGRELVIRNSQVDFVSNDSRGDGPEQ